MARDYPFAASVARRAGARLVLTRHVLFPLSRIHRLTLRRTSRVIAVSEAVAEGLRAQKIFEPDTIICIQNGIDVNRFEQSREAVAQGRPAADRKLRVGMIGHLAPIKGQEDFIRASAVLCNRRDDVEFIIAGEDKSRSGDNRRRLEKLIADFGLGDHISLVGWVDDIATLLATLDLFVSPSRSEPFGLSIVEAMAAGVPVLATSSEGAREIIDEGQTGQLVPIGDTESLTKAMDQVLSDPNQRERLSENARRVVRERFSLGRMLEATEQVYRETGVRS
jgi:glycosyltransferase involved in cell wall biosynthesis